MADRISRVDGRVYNDIEARFLETTGEVVFDRLTARFVDRDSLKASGPGVSMEIGKATPDYVKTHGRIAEAYGVSFALPEPKKRATKKRASKKVDEEQVDEEASDNG